jgi:hypothetical protein
MEYLDSESIQRLGQQSRFLLRIHQAELAKDPSSRATESSRSNLMAVRHTVKQMYGEAVAVDFASLRCTALMTNTVCGRWVSA